MLQEECKLEGWHSLVLLDSVGCLQQKKFSVSVDWLAGQTDTILGAWIVADYTSSVPHAKMIKVIIKTSLSVIS